MLAILNRENLTNPSKGGVRKAEKHRQAGLAGRLVPPCTGLPMRRQVREAWDRS